MPRGLNGRFRRLAPLGNFASLIPPTALRLWAPPVHVATGGHGFPSGVSLRKLPHSFLPASVAKGPASCTLGAVKVAEFGNND